MKRLLKSGLMIAVTLASAGTIFGAEAAAARPFFELPDGRTIRLLVPTDIETMSKEGIALPAFVDEKDGSKIHAMADDICDCSWLFSELDGFSAIDQCFIRDGRHARYIHGKTRFTGTNPHCLLFAHIILATVSKDDLNKANAAALKTWEAGFEPFPGDKPDAAERHQHFCNENFEKRAALIKTIDASRAELQKMLKYLVLREIG